MLANSPENNNEGRDIFRGGKPLVASGHDEPDNTLQPDTKGKSVAGTDPVTDKGSKGGAWNVEAVHHGRPSEALPQGSLVAQDDLQPGRRINGETVGREVVEEPND
jgi:hypothetical protein